MKISEIVSEDDLFSIKKFGIYKISYKNKVYIGSTTQSFYIRWIQHMYEMKNFKHSNQKIMNIINKYGIDKLIFEIVEVVDNKNKVLEREQYWIDLFNSYYEGLNCSPSAYNTFGYKRSEETLQKYFYHEVSQYNKQGDYIKTFPSMKHAASETQTDYVTLSNVCNGKTRLANGFQWRKGNSIENIGGVKYKGETTVYQYDIDGNYIGEWNSLKEIAEKFNKAGNTISIAISKGSAINDCYLSKTKQKKIKFRHGKQKKFICHSC